MPREFRTPASLQAEKETRAKICPFLETLGFRNLQDQRKSDGSSESQTIRGVDPLGREVAMRVNLCWRRGREGKVETYSATQLMAKVTVGDGIVEGSLVPFHYLGLKDDVDFEQIPWRNGRFDLTALEEKLENSERMERLWTAWQADPDARTLVFCCSRRHALYTRDWLRRRKVRTAAVFSGTGGDPRSDSLSNFINGELQALCVVDLFNEGLDVPDVERVVMLRPTESKVIFLQQLGRGLRAAENKLRLKVIDFVGNHRVFASRLTHLLSLGNKSATWTDLKNFLKGGTPDLPAGCLLDLEVEAKELMLRLVPATGSAVVEAYRSMRDELGRRPSPSELFHHGSVSFPNRTMIYPPTSGWCSHPSHHGSPCWRAPTSTNPTKWSSCACCWIAMRCGTGWKSKNSPPPAANFSFPTHLRVVDASPDTEETESRDLPGFVEAPAAKDKFTRLVPVYSLEAAAGLWGPETTPEEIGWAEAAGTTIKPGMFIARVRGHSMEPKIKDGSWNLFRICPQGSREGRIVLVQFNSMGDPENGGRFTVKKYHSEKTVSENAWQHEQIELLPLNPDYDPIPVAPHEGPEMVVVGEWVATID